MNNDFNPNSFNTQNRPNHPDYPRQHQQGFTNVQHVQTRRFSTRSLYSVGLVIGLVVVIVAGLFFHNRGSHSDTIPVVQADSRPFKVRAPVEETVIPHSEKTIYAELGSGEVVNRVENLLADPEKPQIQMPSLPDDFMAALSESGDADSTVESKTGESHNATSYVMPLQNYDGSVVQDQLDVHDNVSGTPGSQSAFEDVTTTEHESFIEMPSKSIAAHDVSSIPSPHDTINTITSTSMAENTAPSATMEVSSLKVKSSKLAVNKNTTAAALSDSYRIQLYSGVSQKNVSTYWKSLKQKSGGLLASYTPVVHKVDLGAVKGIHYRLQFGEFTKKEAFAFCSRLKERSIDCWPVKR